ncbi:MAG: hypothetical protein ACYC38_13930, partial [Eubacteriales bacterium]
MALKDDSVFKIKAEEEKFMFVLKDKLAKIAMSCVVASFLTFTTILPANADDFQPKEDSNPNITVQEEIYGGSLCPLHSDLSNQAAAQITIKENGQPREILVWPRANLNNRTT